MQKVICFSFHHLNHPCTLENIRFCSTSTEETEGLCHSIQFCLEFRESTMSAPFFSQGTSSSSKIGFVQMLTRPSFHLSLTDQEIPGFGFLFGWSRSWGCHEVVFNHLPANGNDTLFSIKAGYFVFIGAKAYANSAYVDGEFTWELTVDDHCFCPCDLTGHQVGSQTPYLYFLNCRSNLRIRLHTKFTS